VEADFEYTLKPQLLFPLPMLDFYKSFHIVIIIIFSQKQMSSSCG